MNFKQSKSPLKGVIVKQETKKMQDWTKKEVDILRKYYPSLPLKKLCRKIKRTASAIRTKAIKLKIKKINSAAIVFTKEKKELLTNLYPNTKNVDIAKVLGFTESSIIAAAFRYKLKKSKEFMRLHAEAGMFKPGQKVWNKGMKGLNIGGIETQFKTGQRGWNYKPIGTERITKDGYMEVKVKEPKTWKGKHVVEWEKENGPIPKGFIVVFKTTDKLNTSVDNLEMISRAENMKRNTVHNYPKEIALTIQLRGALNRQINKHKKKVYEK